MGDLLEIKNKLKQDFNDVYYKGQLETLNNYDSFKDEASGVAIAVNDVSSVNHNVGVQLRSKNLFDASLIPTQTAVNTGMSIEYEGDGVIHLYGTCTTANAITVGMCQTNIPVEIGSYYTVSATLISGSTSRDFANFFSNSNDISTTVNWTNSFIRTTTAIDETTYRLGVVNNRYINKFWVYIIAGAVGDAIDCRVRVQLEKGNVSTEYTPYINDFSNIEVTRYGKNLCSDNFDDYNHDKFYGYKYMGEISSIMSSIDKDTSVDCSGCYFGVAFDPSTSTLANNINWLIQNGVSKNYLGNVVDKRPYLAFYPNNEETFNKIIQRWEIQVELGNIATVYEPYIESTTYTANADGTVEGVTSIAPNMTLLTDNSGTIINCNYFRDIDKYINNLKTDIALTGGE